jgi:hypothetical protein
MLALGDEIMNVKHISASAKRNTVRNTPLKNMKAHGMKGSSGRIKPTILLRLSLALMLRDEK